MEDVGGDLGHAEEESRVPQAKAGEVGGGAAEPDRPEIVAADATINAGITAEAGLVQTEGAATTEVVASRPATDEATAGEIAAAEASFGSAGLGDLREVAGEVVKEVPASTRASEPPAMDTQATSSLELAPSAMTDAPVPEMRLVRPSVPFSLESPPTLRGLLTGLMLLGWWKVTTAKLPQLPGPQPKAVQGERHSQLRPGPVLAARAPLASSKRSGRILLPVPGLKVVVKPGVAT
jgi:hypothetical protein